MPKIQISEFDATSQRNQNSTDFTVLIPGFYAPGKETNGEDIKLFTNTTDFISAVGCVEPSTGSTVAEYSVLEAGIDGDNYYGQITIDQFYELVYAGKKLCKIKADANEITSAPNPGPEYAQCGNGKWIEIDTASIKSTAKDYELKIADINEDGKTIAKWAIVKSIGHTASASTVVNYGNQMAYELLALGYSVLYKKVKTTNVTDLETESFWAELYDKSLYDFRFIATGLLADSSYRVSEQIIKLAASRGDCTAIVDLNESEYSTDNKQAAFIANLGSKAAELKALFAAKENYNYGKYADIIMPYVEYKYTIGTNKDYYENTKLPGAFHRLACAMNAIDHGYAEWWAVSGYDRGVCKYPVINTGILLGEKAIEELGPRPYETRESFNLPFSINPIVQLRGTYYLWGARTAYRLDTADEDLKASHFLNIRQLCTTLKKHAYLTCKKYKFDPNSDILWINFKNEIERLLEEMKSNQGIDDYKVIKEEDTKKATIKALIRIVPVEPVEDFYLDLYLEDSISGTIVSIEEIDN